MHPLSWPQRSRPENLFTHDTTTETEIPTCQTIGDVKRFLGEENGLAVISTTQADGRVLLTIANCGVLDHPVTGTPCVGLVSAGGAGPIDPHPPWITSHDCDPTRVGVVLGDRAGRHHWARRCARMGRPRGRARSGACCVSSCRRHPRRLRPIRPCDGQERRAAVLVSPDRILGNS